MAVSDSPVDVEETESIEAEKPEAEEETPEGARAEAERSPADRSPADRSPGDRRPYHGSGAQRSGSYGRGGDRRSEADGDRSRGRYKVYFRKKVCKFCTKKIGIHYLDYETLRRFTTDRGKMLPARITGNCAKHQRQLAKAIKRARSLALLPFATR